MFLLKDLGFNLIFMVKLTHIAGSSNGRIHGSEPWHLGSNPSPAAKTGSPRISSMIMENLIKNLEKYLGKKFQL